MSSDERATRLLATLGEMGPSTHLCTIYDSLDEHLIAAAAVFRLGLMRGHRCLFIADASEAALLEALRSAGIDVAAARQAGRLVMSSKDEAYLRDGRFDSGRMVGWIGERIDEARASGFSGLSLIGEMTWALAPSPGVERLGEYESRLNDLARHRPAVLLCQYHRPRFGAETIRQIIATHPYVILGETICKNPHYQPPERYLTSDWPRREIEWLVENLQRLEDTERDLRRSQERYRDLARRLLEVQEIERQSLARELHDHMGQDLLAIKMSLQALRRAELSAGLAPRLEEAMALADRAMEQARTLAFDLRPAALDDVGLVAALRGLTSEHGRRFGHRVAFSASAVPSDVPPEIATACYRIVQQALTNAVLHARASNIAVALEASEGTLQVTVRDDGTGFDLAEVRARGAPRAAIGIAGMEERAELAGGHLEIRSAPGQGTTVVVRFPMSPRT